MSKRIINSAVAPVASALFAITVPNRAATVFMRNDADPGTLTPGDNANIQISHDDGATWVNLIKSGQLVALTDTNNHESVYALGTFRVNLNNVTGPLSVYVNT